MASIIVDFVRSWSCTEGNVNSTEKILEWIDEKNQTMEVCIEKIKLEENGFWFFDNEKGIIHNRNNSFFTIEGYTACSKNGRKIEQPIIVQSEIGYLGIICKKINGVLNFLMQAKVEPGNINKIQLSPTIQATKSNFTRKHGGGSPPFLDFFLHADNYNIIVDQIQSEQSSRFYKKRNRNILIEIPENEVLEERDSHRWMTLGQIKRIMEIDNMVNMDTRTVLSCIPYSVERISDEDLQLIFRESKDIPLFNSIYKKKKNLLPKLYHEINDYKMFCAVEGRRMRLDHLDDWEIARDSIICKKNYPFKVIFCNVTIEGREVKQWEQPLFEAEGRAWFGLLTRVKNSVRQFLIKVHPEIGSFDGIELGPTVQLEANYDQSELDEVEVSFFDKYFSGTGIKKNVLLSEEGGRFYHEENYNIIIDVGDEPFDIVPKGYFWVDYATLNQMVQINNCLNIQLRNIISLLDL